MERKLTKPQGLLLVVSGPSGAGKGTICNLLREKLPELAYSVSVTSRQPRPGEVDGQDYAQVYGNYYGTPKPYVQKLLDEGKDVLLEIDIQGALQIKKVFPGGVFVFVVPPSLEELSARIYKRGTDREDVIRQRLAAATHELVYANEYDYIIVNDVAEKAAERVLTLLEAERYRAARTYFVVDKIIHPGADKQ